MSDKLKFSTMINDITMFINLTMPLGQFPRSRVLGLKDENILSTQENTVNRI